MNYFDLALIFIGGVIYVYLFDKLVHIICRSLEGKNCTDFQKADEDDVNVEKEFKHLKKEINKLRKEIEELEKIEAQKKE